MGYNNGKTRMVCTTAKRSGRDWEERKPDNTLMACWHGRPGESKSKREPRSERDAWIHFRNRIPGATA